MDLVRVWTRERKRRKVVSCRWKSLKFDGRTKGSTTTAEKPELREEECEEEAEACFLEGASNS